MGKRLHRQAFSGSCVKGIVEDATVSATCFTMKGGRKIKRCHAKNCDKEARGSTEYCSAHGGGKRCQKPNCDKGALGSTKYCRAHGGGKIKRCQAKDCDKEAQ